MAIKFVDRVPTYPGRIKFTKEDGTTVYGVWERADSPTVAGTPLNAANLNAMQAGMGLSATTTLYVSTTGSDTTGDGTQAKPYATIKKTLATLPKNLNGFDVTIMVSPGTYSESVDVSYFFGGLIIFKGGAVTTSGFRVFDSLVEFSGMTLSINGTTVTGDALHVSGGRLRSYNDISVTTSGIGMRITNGGQLLMGTATANFSGTSYAVTAEQGGIGVFGTLNGSTTSLLNVSKGATVTYEGLLATASSNLYITASGGRIYNGAQASPASY